MYLIDDITVTGFFSHRSHIPFRGPSSEPYPRPNHTINVLPIQYHKTRQKIVKIGHWCKWKVWTSPRGGGERKWADSTEAYCVGRDVWRRERGGAAEDRAEAAGERESRDVGWIDGGSQLEAAVPLGRLEESEVRGIIQMIRWKPLALKYNYEIFFTPSGVNI